MNREQIVCTCNGITTAQIERAAVNGARSFEDLQERLHIGKQCIRCKEIAQMILENAVEDIEGGFLQ